MTAAVQISEAELQQAVIDTARTFGWRCAHFRPARTKHGWQTPVAADGKGFPDLVLVNRQTGRLIFAELKSDRGKTTPEQDDWLRDLQAVAAQIGETAYPGHGPLHPLEVHVWTPADWPERIVAILTGKPTTERSVP